MPTACAESLAPHRGEGAYYGEAGYGAGWVGTKSNGAPKAVTGGTPNLGLTVKVCVPATVCP